MFCEPVFHAPGVVSDVNKDLDFISGKCHEEFIDGYAFVSDCGNTGPVFLIGYLFFDFTENGVFRIVIVDVGDEFTIAFSGKVCKLLGYIFRGSVVRNQRCIVSEMNMGIVGGDQVFFFHTVDVVEEFEGVRSEFIGNETIGFILVVCFVFIGGKKEDFCEFDF